MLSKRRELALAAVQADAFYVTSPANVRYLTGFTGSNGQLLLGTREVFLTDGRYTQQASEEVGRIPVRIYQRGMLEAAVSRECAELGVRTLAVESSHLTVDEAQSLAAALPGVRIVYCGPVIERLRMRKEAGEIAAIRAAQRIAEAALVRCLSRLDGGTEVDLAMALEWEMRSSGAQGISFDLIVAGGPHSALPHATPRRVEIDPEAVLLVDMGCIVDGYCSDMTRTYLPPHGDGLLDAHRAVVAALDAACGVVAPGVPAADVDKIACDVLRDAGFGDNIVHSTGHGVGLQIHEPPRLGAESGDVLEPGMVITVEPGVYLPAVGGVRIEDLLLVTADGAENLTALDRSAARPAQTT